MKGLVNILKGLFFHKHYLYKQHQAKTVKNSSYLREFKPS